MKKFFRKIFKKAKKNKENPYKIENEINKLINKIIEDTDSIFDFSDEEIKIIQSNINDKEKLIYKKIKLPIFCHGSISCFFDLGSDDNNNYIIRNVQPDFKKIFPNLESGSKILSIQELEQPKIEKFRRFNPTSSKKELNLIEKNIGVHGPLDLFVCNRLPKTIIKLKIKKKNKIKEIIFKLGSAKDKLKSLQTLSKAEYGFNSRQSLAFKKHYIEEIFYSGDMSANLINSIKADKKIDFKPKNLVERFLELESDHSVVYWGETLINRLEKIIKKVSKPKTRKLRIFKGSYLDIFYNPHITKRLPIVHSYLNNETYVSGKIPSVGDKLISITYKNKTAKIKSIDDISDFLINVPPNSYVKLVYETKSKNKHSFKLLTQNFDELCNSYIKYTGSQMGNYSKAEIAANQFRKSYLIGEQEADEKFFIQLMKKNILDTVSHRYVSKEDEEKNELDNKKISFSISKEKISNKMSFLLKFDAWPNIENLLIDNKSLFLNVFIYDITDLNYQKIGELKDEYLDVEDYIKKDCHIIKTNDASWSHANNNLVQSKKIKDQYDLPEELAFPFQVITFPKGGKRKLNFRVFLTNENVKFDEYSSRPIISGLNCYRPDEFEVMQTYSGEYDFDPYGDYDDIKIYGSNQIEAEYKLPGYLETNRKEMAYFKSIIAANLIKIRDKDPKKIFEILRDEIDYDDDGYEYEKRHIYKTLDLKRVYEDLMNENSGKKIDFKSIRNKTLVNERYNILNTLLNLSTRNKKFFSAEDVFLNDVAKKLEIDFDKFTEIKKQKTINAELINFSASNEEDIFGIKETMTKDQKIKILRNEYSRWNALTNHADKTKRDKAKNMRDLAAKLRSKIN